MQINDRSRLALAGAPQSPAEFPLKRFWATWQRLNRASLEWLGTQPAPADVDAEVEDTITALRQIARGGEGAL